MEEEAALLNGLDSIVGGAFGERIGGCVVGMSPLLAVSPNVSHRRLTYFYRWMRAEWRYCLGESERDIVRARNHHVYLLTVCITGFPFYSYLHGTVGRGGCGFYNSYA